MKLVKSNETIEEPENHNLPDELKKHLYDSQLARDQKICSLHSLSADVNDKVDFWLGLFSPEVGIDILKNATIKADYNMITMRIEIELIGPINKDMVNKIEQSFAKDSPYQIGPESQNLKKVA